MDHDALYRCWLTEVWRGDEAAARAVVAPSFVGHWPGGDVHGVDALLAVVQQTRGMFDALDFALEVGPVAAGDLVAARWTGTGRRAGTTTRFYGHDLLRVADGRVVEYWPATVTLDGP